METAQAADLDLLDRVLEEELAIKKKRSNFRLRKQLVPKAPLCVLNEMVGQVSYTFVETNPLHVQQANAHVRPGMPKMELFTAQCEIEGEIFSGTGE